MPVYIITNRATKEKRAVSANNKAHAVRHVASEVFDVATASADDLAAAVLDGVKCEQAKAVDPQE